MAIEIVDLPINSMVIFHSYVAMWKFTRWYLKKKSGMVDVFDHNWWVRLGMLLMSPTNDWWSMKLRRFQRLTGSQRHTKTHVYVVK